MTARWSDLGVAGKQIVRDLWRQKDLGTFEGQFSAPVGRMAWCSFVCGRHNSTLGVSGFEIIDMQRPNMMRGIAVILPAP